MRSHMFENFSRRCSDLWKSIRESVTSAYITISDNFPSLSTVMVIFGELLFLAIALCTFGIIGYISWRLFRAFISGILFFLLFAGGSLVLFDCVAFDGSHLASALDSLTGPSTADVNENRLEIDRGGGKGDALPSFMNSIP
jgi:hypothetical protein